MGVRQHITEYVWGEAIGIRAQLHDRDGNALNLSGVALTFIISDESQRTRLIDMKGSDITVTTAASGEILIGLTLDRYRALKPEINYRYDLWSGNSDADRLHQAGGLFVLKKAMQP